MSRIKKLTYESACGIKALIDAKTKYQDIQKIFSVSVGAISDIKKRFNTEKEIADYYIVHRTEINEHIQARCDGLIEDNLELLQKKTLTKPQVDKISKIIDTVRKVKADAYSEERLEKGESTEEINITHKYILEMRKRDRQNEQIIDVTPERNRTEAQG